MTIWNGITEQGAVVPIQVDAQGRVVVSGGGGAPSEVFATAFAAGRFTSDGQKLWGRNLAISKVGTGTYNLIFETPSSIADYAVLATNAEADARFIVAYQQTTTSFRILIRNQEGAYEDKGFSVAVFNPDPQVVTPLILPTSTVNEVKALRSEIDKLKKDKNP